MTSTYSVMAIGNQTNKKLYRINEGKRLLKLTKNRIKTEVFRTEVWKFRKVNTSKPFDFAWKWIIKNGLDPQCGKNAILLSVFIDVPPARILKGTIFSFLIKQPR